jgi:hypothetical protein
LDRCPDRVAESLIDRRWNGAIEDIRFVVALLSGISLCAAIAPNARSARTQPAAHGITLRLIGALAVRGSSDVKSWS